MLRLEADEEEEDDEEDEEDEAACLCFSKRFFRDFLNLVDSAERSRLQQELFGSRSVGSATLLVCNVSVRTIAGL